VALALEDVEGFVDDERGLLARRAPLVRREHRRRGPDAAQLRGRVGGHALVTPGEGIDALARGEGNKLGRWVRVAEEVRGLSVEDRQWHAPRVEARPERGARADAVNLFDHGVRVGRGRDMRGGGRTTLCGSRRQGVREQHEAQQDSHEC